MASVGSLVASHVRAATPCEDLATLTLPNAHVTSAETVAAGTFQPPPGPRGGGRGSARLYASLPAFCRVEATLTPSSDSDIKAEVWLPTSTWNGKLQAVGNGGWAGVISYASLAQAVAAGYAGASTDAGHVGNTAAFAVGHPEKVVDMGYRAVHEMTVKAKAVMDAFYGSGPKLSIWNGCSFGGRQGITEAQRYPADYDAIIAGAPAVNWMRLHGVRMAINQRAHASEDSYITPDKYPAIHTAMLNTCDASDGVEDGVVEDPTRCHFDPKVLECKGPNGPGCLTPGQVQTARALYAPLKSTKTGATIFPSLLLPGSEPNWATLAGPEPVITAFEAFQYVVFKDPAYDPSRFNLDTDLPAAMKMDAGVLNSGYDQPETLFCARRKTPDVPRLGGSPGATHEQRRVFRRRREGGRQGGRGQVDRALHGAGHGALPGRTRHRCVRQDGRHRAMGLARRGARPRSWRRI